jgi:uncharacterized protein YukJ
MPLPNYGVLVGTIKDKLDSPAALQKNPGSKPHFQILVEANNVLHRIAVNVKSNQQPSDLQFYLDADYRHPIVTHIKQLPVGFSPLPAKPDTAALDFIRGNLFDFKQMKIMPTLQGGPNNDLNDIFNVHIEHAINTPGALIYAFGSKWGPETNKRDEYFDFLPGNGIHDIHMNQGNVGAHAGDNGTYQDGGLFIHFPGDDKWLAMFMKFQSQVVHTSDPGEPVPGDPVPTPQLPEEATPVMIIAARVNPVGDDMGKEFVYLLNTSDKDINIDGWSLADKRKNTDTIHNGVLKAGDISKITLNGKGAQLSNDGGIITLLNKQGLKIHGVSYTKDQSKSQGATIAF